MGKIKLSRDIVTGGTYHASIAIECKKNNELELAYLHMYKAYLYQSEWLDRLNEIIDENDLEDKLKEKKLEY